MLKIVVTSEFWDEVEDKFVDRTMGVLHLEHSLVSLAKWESKWEKPYLSKEAKTTDEVLSYVECMSLDEEFSNELLNDLTQEQWDEIAAYTTGNMTATTFREIKTPPRTREIITAEIMYYWLVQMRIPFEVQHWHLNRLFTLVRVINEKNTPPKKLTPAEAAAERRRLNLERRAQYGTKG